MRKLRNYVLVGQVLVNVNVTICVDAAYCDKQFCDSDADTRRILTTYGLYFLKMYVPIRIAYMYVWWTIAV